STAALFKANFPEATQNSLRSGLLRRSRAFLVEARLRNSARRPKLHTQHESRGKSHENLSEVRSGTSCNSAAMRSRHGGRRPAGPRGQVAIHVRTSFVAARWRERLG